MNPPKCDELDYIHVLVAAQHVLSTTAAAHCHPGAPTNGPAHAASTRLLHRCCVDGTTVWEEVRPCVSVTTGCLMIDDTTLDKPYSRAMELITRHWSGNHQRVVVGIHLIRMRWTDGNAHLPCDFRMYDNAHDGLAKNDHVRTMVQAAAARGCQPRLLAVDSWYASLENLTLVRSLPWPWLTHLNANRLGNPDGSGNRPIRDVPIPAAGTIVYLKGDGVITVVAMATPAGGMTTGPQATWRWVPTSGWRTPALDGTAKRTIAVALRTAASNAPSTAPLVPSGIISVWRCGPSSAWNITGCGQARRGLRSKPPLSVRRYEPTWLIHALPSSQLRNS